ncbi:MAG: T9SS type A sorting domain-containing protein, partial [Fibrobacteres bacterium]|nr:T9SS type A sorting domain-containing protein [Fibrobacterota bacterium]
PVVTNSTDTTGKPAAGSSFTISASVSDNIANTRVTLYFRNGGGTTYDSIVIADSQNNGFTHTLNLSGNGLEYYIRAFDGNSSVVSTRYSVSVKLVNLTSPNAFPAGEWRMFSVPARAVNDSLLRLFKDWGSYLYDWRLYEWKGTAYTERGEDRSAKIVSGKPYWLKTVKTDKKFIVDTAYTVSTNKNFEITLLPKEWTPIANPFNFTVSWASVVAATGKDSMVTGPYTYAERSWFNPRNVLALVPWQGYYVYNHSDSVIVLKIPPIEYVGPITVAKTATVKTGNMEFAWEVSSADRIDRNNYFGISDNGKSTAGYDYGLDALRAPEGPDKGVRAVFTRAEYEKDLRRLCVDYSAMENGGAEWNVSIEAISADALYISNIKGLEYLPEGVSAVVVDSKRGIKVDVTNREYTFTADRNEAARKLNVLVGTDAYITARTNGLKELPLVSGMENNYPNPFNPVTTISYSVAGKSRQLVTLSIYDVKGKLVKELVNKPLESGHYKISWNGCGNNNKPAGSGVYVYRLKIGNKFQKSMMMVLVK